MSAIEEAPKPTPNQLPAGPESQMLALRLPSWLRRRSTAAPPTASAASPCRGSAARGCRAGGAHVAVELPSALYRAMAVPGWEAGSARHPAGRRGSCVVDEETTRANGAMAATHAASDATRSEAHVDRSMRRREVLVVMRLMRSVHGHSRSGLQPASASISVCVAFVTCAGSTHRR